MRAHNYYAAPGFERAGLRRRDSGWIVERIADPASLFVPVWRNQNLIIEIDGGEPRAVVLGWGGLAPLIGGGAAEERLARGEIVFIGVVEERAHFALDLIIIVVSHDNNNNCLAEKKTLRKSVKIAQA